ncbi:hypothetical protein GGR50DRAFT_22211 [Xylaria sp. CBS 124048]|nr:hypothetical protein GGR50DRAFT_22211 [Xylaria sp. CBS 124048]
MSTVFLTLAPTPTLPADWAPAATTCLQKDDYWIWDYEANLDAPTVIGPPAQTTECFTSPTWGPDVTYAATACPTLYTAACQDGRGVVTCCPWVDHFTCQPETWGLDTHASERRCMSQYTSKHTVKVTRTYMTRGGTKVENRTASTNLHIFALAMMYTTPSQASPQSNSFQSLE